MAELKFSIEVTARGESTAIVSPSAPFRLRRVVVTNRGAAAVLLQEITVGKTSLPQTGPIPAFVLTPDVAPPPLAPPICEVGQNIELRFSNVTTEKVLVEGVLYGEGK